jgi:hypothetical protein
MGVGQENPLVLIESPQVRACIKRGCVPFLTDVHPQGSPIMTYTALREIVEEPNVSGVHRRFPCVDVDFVLGTSGGGRIHGSH